MVSTGILFTLTALFTFSSTLSSPLPKRDLGPVTIFSPPSDYKDQRTLYGRSVRLQHQPHSDKHSKNSDNGAILATWENYTPVEPPYFPIYRSDDTAATWYPYSNVTDQVNGFGLRYQPFLYELPKAFGGWDKGTVLLAGNSIPEDLSSTHIDLYASKDAGRSWEFVSHIAQGGEALPDNGLTPVWEPFLLLHSSQLIVYYSDQRDPLYGQKLVHQTTTDGYNWDAVIDDEKDTGNYTARPGMPIVSKLGNGDWFYSYEYYGAKEVDFAVYYKIASSPLHFGSVTGQPLIAEDGYVPSSSPYNVFTPAGGANGTIVLDAGSSSDLFLNRAYGQGKWERVQSASPASYTRSLDLLKGGEAVLIVGGGPITGNGSTNSVTATVQTVA